MQESLCNMADRVDSLFKAELLEQAEAAIPGLLKNFEDILKTNDGGKGYFVGDKVRGDKIQY